MGPKRIKGQVKTFWTLSIGPNYMSLGPGPIDNRIGGEPKLHGGDWWSVNVNPISKFKLLRHLPYPRHVLRHVILSLLSMSLTLTLPWSSHLWDRDTAATPTIPLLHERHRSHPSSLPPNSFLRQVSWRLLPFSNTHLPPRTYLPRRHRRTPRRRTLLDRRLCWLSQDRFCSESPLQAPRRQGDLWHPCSIAGIGEALRRPWPSDS